MMQEKKTANHAAAISQKQCEAVLENCLRKGGDSSVWLHETQLSRDANIKNQDFSCPI